MNKKNTFRPFLNENTKRIVQKMSQNKELNLNQYNNLYNQTNERELLEKLRLQMKPVLSEVFDINNQKRPFISKKSYYLAKPKSIFYYIVKPRMLKTDFALSEWKIGFLKRLLKIKLPYFKIYKIYKKNKK